MSCRLSTRAAFAVTLALAAGCGGNGPYPVEGVVLLDGQPLEGASITLVPEGPGQPAVGTTAADGRFRLSTQAGNGAMRSTYRAILTKITGPEEGRPPWVGRKGQPPSSEEMAAWKRHAEEVK